MVPTRHAKIAVWKPPHNAYDPARIQRMIDELEPLQHCTDRAAVLATLTAFVPEMKPWVEEPSHIAKSPLQDAPTPD
jgi:hypothetical protein